MDAFVENITLTKIHVSKKLIKKPTFYPSCPFSKRLAVGERMKELKEMPTSEGPQ